MQLLKRGENETYRDFNNRKERAVQLLICAALVFAMLGLLSLAGPH